MRDSEIVLGPSPIWSGISEIFPDQPVLVRGFLIKSLYYRLYIIIIYKLPGLVGISILLKVSNYFRILYFNYFYEVTLTLRLSAIHNTNFGPAIYGLSLEEVFDSTIRK